MNPISAPHSGRSGFTLIEMMIAIGLGMLVVFVATAGLRTAAQSVASANRLALENSILRTGMVVALEHTDFWTDYDDPTYDPASTEGKIMRPYCRKSGDLPADAVGVQRGLPFTPFTESRSATGYGPRTQLSPIEVAPVDVSDTVKRGLGENDSGWDPNAWNAAEARGWNWGNLTERTPRSSSVTSRMIPIAKYKIFGHTETIASTEPSASTPNHHWQQRQLDGLNRSLGSYGLFDYLPANTGLMIYEKITNPSGPNSSDLNKWQTAKEWCSPDGGSDYRLASDGNLSFALDRLADTWGTVFAMPNRAVAENLRSRVTNRRYGTGIAIDASSNQSSADGIEQLLINHEQVDRVLTSGDATNGPNKPGHWPSLTVSSLRFIRTGAFINLNRISWVNSMTGEGLELSFSCFGTTLRGARQQRLRDTPGWAEPFPEGGTPKPHLDSYAAP
jgi:prepilin-type N-terminal cleavage/methylation domain-containing protein